MSFQDKKDRLLELLKTPAGLAAFLCLIGCIAVIIISIIALISSSNREPKVPSEVDPASGETIYLFPYTNDPPVEPMYIGFGVLSQNGLTPQQFQLFKAAVETFAEKNDITLERVSYLKDSYRLKASYVFDFSIVLNVDGQELAVEVDSSKGWKDIMGAIVTIWQDNEEVFKLEVNESNICEYRKGCYYEDDGT